MRVDVRCIHVSEGERWSIEAWAVGLMSGRYIHTVCILVRVEHLKV